jgi:hypothetical protein
MPNFQALDPTYQPPAQFAYKNSKLEDKVDVPQARHYINTPFFLIISVVDP